MNSYNLGNAAQRLGMLVGRPTMIGAVSGASFSKFTISSSMLKDLLMSIQCFRM